MYANCASFSIQVAYLLKSAIKTHDQTHCVLKDAYMSSVQADTPICTPTPPARKYFQEKRQKAKFIMI